MSRLIVKNLPPYVTPARLQQHFEQKGAPKGTLTDVKVALKSDGTSRRFGFVGYKSEKEALAAKEWFDKTFVDSTRISVNVIEDAPTPRPNKRSRSGPYDDSIPDEQQGKKKKAKTEESEPVKETKEKSKKNLQMEEFLDVMKPRPKNAPSWANETTQPQASTSATKLDDAVENAEMDAEDPVQDEALSDTEWMRRRMTNAVDDGEKVFEQDDEDTPTRASSLPKEEEPKDPTKETILQTARLFVRNLAFSCTETDLSELFSPFGTLSQVHIPLDHLTRQGKGLAYITFARAEDAVSAYEALDKKSFQGRLLHILAAIDRKGKFQVEEGDGNKRSLKEERNAKRKATAGKEFNWSMLYMNSDAVASSIADRMNIPKAAILNPDSSDDPSSSSTNAAVKLALAETHIINETKAYLEANGVVLSAFSSPRTARSDTTILVKNIPYGTSEEQLRELFEPHGTVSRALIPPAGTIAVIDFEQPDEASKAFKAVAYRRLGNSIVYLEKAPVGIFAADGSQSTTGTSSKGGIPSYAVKIPEQEAAVGEDGAVEDEPPSLSAGTTLFVKNLAFSTSTERLTQMFRNLPSFSFARVQTKPDPKKPEGRLSMGYGFIGFKDVEGAKKAMKSMQGFVLDGHALHMKFAGRGTEEDETKGKGGVGSKSRTTKMIVKNVPFEATKKDIRDLFGTHGQLKSVRLPKKFDSRSRGFAFLEFVSRHEAENAFAALRHTHLLGRHLVLEWAEEAEQDIDALRKKAGVGFGDGKDLPGHKKKLDMNVVDEGGADEDD
ncbi:RNA-binding domain-containing protein [Dendrothele bispora CBS 962.96]|uniref:Multiple RNA-binding domain-containing protein 1 n=1 Tax=Dendrothele bispora (strain CBS 962.96) TaxID=1314807 RepID=A0A4S8L8H4_DENBC|nr:RNA-binding domain-containing protein [Dendrothele bispora CBS 962.96]